MLLFFGGPLYARCITDGSALASRCDIKTQKEVSWGKNLLKHLLPVVTRWSTTAKLGLCLTRWIAVVGGEVGAPVGPDSAGEPHTNVTVPRLKGQSVYL